MKLQLIVTEKELEQMGGDAAKLEQLAYDCPGSFPLPAGSKFGRELVLNFLEVVVVDA
jgi:hypothetical protein